MVDTIQKNDFIEIVFDGIANGEVFDTTSVDVAKKMGLEADVKPLIISVGNDMLLKGFDKDLIGKEVGKDYKVHLSPEEAFGKRNPSMVKMMPIKVFHEKKISPYPGLTLQMDNYLVKIISVSGGRVMVDFNNPLAGKEIDYNYKISRRVTDPKEKVDSIQEFFFRIKFPYKLENNQVIFDKPEIKPFVDIYKEKFKEMTGLEFIAPEKLKVETKEDKPKVTPKEKENKETTSKN